MAEAAVLDLDPFGDDFLCDPDPYHEQLREAGPVVFLERYSVWAMARFAEVQAALRDHETFCSSAGVGLSDFRKEKAWRPPLRVFPDAVGLSEEGRENLLGYGSMVFNAFGPRNQLFTEAMATVGPVGAWIADRCKREALAPDGLGGQIYAAADAGELTADEAALLVRSLLSAGIDTTTYALACALDALATRPDQWTALRGDPTLARAAFEETLRFDDGGHGDLDPVGGDRRDHVGLGQVAHRVEGGTGNQPVDEVVGLGLQPVLDHAKCARRQLALENLRSRSCA